MVSTLNPYAAPFVPSAFREVEDFSSEWWQLVKSSPWFCDYWLRECFDEEDLNETTQIDPELSDIDEILPLDTDLHSPTALHEEKGTRSKGKMELMAWGADKWAMIRGKTSLGRRYSEKAPKIVRTRVIQRTIQQPR
ncbi:hypothetical protein HPP92_013420 [Vanilla planifolia]|uniref:Uncharacterized protein n=1 Tax=Vanilla planifolia TaxID=51239 RepID=A0A835QSA7_VANPL|nr:hypothetical protein HPP92_013420 [Vanilla planifolia]